MEIKQVGNYTIFQINNKLKQVYGKNRMIQTNGDKKIIVDLVNNKIIKTAIDTFEKSK